MPAYPFKLGKPQGCRRLLLLETIAEEDRPVALSEMETKEGKDDVRWLWDKDLLTVVASTRAGLRFGITIKGAAAVANADEERIKFEERTAA